MIVVAALLAGTAGAQAPVPEPAPGATASVDHVRYDARMLALANLPRCTTPPAAEPPPAQAGVHPSRRPRPRPCPKPLWPTHTVYPDAGALLPFQRVVAFYGNFYSKQMGILGQYPASEVLDRLHAVTKDWEEADPSTPVMPALDYIAVSAQQSPGPDGMYRFRMPADQMTKALALAQQAHGLLFLDVQTGWSSVRDELPQLAAYMKLPNVELALDPEFSLVRGRRPGAWRGTMNAADINFAARWLAQIVRDNHLPPKILVVHRFTQEMVRNYRGIEPLPEVQIVMDMDGFGLPSDKKAAYRDYIERQPVQFTGFKLFYHNDMKWGHHLMTPAEILALSPRPIYVVYQ